MPGIVIVGAGFGGIGMGTARGLGEAWYGPGVVHLDGTGAEIGPGTSIYLPPYQPHCLENTGPDLLEVLGVFYPAGSPAAKQAR